MKASYHDSSSIIVAPAQIESKLESSLSIIVAQVQVDSKLESGLSCFSVESWNQAPATPISISRFQYIASAKCPYRVAGKASALSAGSDIPNSAYSMGFNLHHHTES